MNDNVILRFSDVNFEYTHNKPILDEASFSVRKGARITLMGQNGAGKSSLFKLIKEVFEVVTLNVPLDRTIKALSGGQQARVLLAHALIQNPDILLLDEPTNNLDPAGLEHLTGFLILYEKTVLVISHDADFLNAFSDG